MIFQRQYNRILAQSILNHLLIGSLPNVNQIARKIEALLGKDGKSLYQYITQPSRSVFQNLVYNKSLKKIKTDIDIIHEEILDLITKASERISYADLYHKVHDYELNKLRSELESILFVVQNADFYFLGAFDNFNDVSKMDSENSTSGIIDLSETCLALPYGGKSTKKINTSHLYNSISWPVSISNPTNVIRSGLVPGTKFSNIFSDIIEAWAYEVITDNPDPLEITLTFPLAGAASQEVEVFVNRFQIISHSPSPQMLKILISNDNINFLPVLGYEEGILLEDQSITYGLDFETNLIQYVRLIFTKDTPDKEIVSGNERTYQYVFGLKNFSAFTIGRVASGRYQSLPFDFSGNEEKISKVSIESLSEVPQGCSINYSIALADSTDNLVTSFIPISPVNQKSSSVGVPTVVNFNTTIPYSRKISVTSTGDDAPQQYGTPFQGKIFYRIGDSIVPKPIFKSCSLFRGFNHWFKDSSSTFKIIDQENIYINFENSDEESIYTTTREIAFAQNQLTVDLNRKVQLTLNNPVYYNQSKGHLLIPPSTVTDPSVDLRANYGIYKVIVNNIGGRLTKSFILSSQLTQFLPVSSFIIQSLTGSDLPILRSSTGQIYRPNIDYIINTVNVDGVLKPIGTFTIPEGSVLLNSSTGNLLNPGEILDFEYTNDPDITHKVISIQDNIVILSDTVINLDESIEVQYRFVPISPNQVIKPSIRLANSPSTTNNRIFYVEGRDYNVNVSTGVIQRIPSGSITTTSSVYLEYSYRSSESDINTFTTWCEISDTSGVQIRFEADEITKKNKLVFDSSLGEGLFVNSSQGLIDLTKALLTPRLGPGWVQFIVRSKNPDLYRAYKTNLIDQVIQLRDINRRKIFKSNNLYFKNIVAFREPLIEVTLNHLKVNTLKSDHQVFAIDSTTDPFNSYIVLNFFPTDTKELYNFSPTQDSDTTSSPAFSPEEFLLQWQTKSDSNLVGSKVVTRIDLDRINDIEGSITPKVFEYRLRASV